MDPPPDDSNLVKSADRLSREKKARECARSSLYGKACGAMVKEPPVKVTEDVISAMKKLHPVARTIDNIKCTGLRPIVANPKWTHDECEEAIKSFPTGSAAGFTGLRPHHIKDALVGGQKDETLKCVAGLCELLASGKAHPSVRQ